jgi:hypothetical protein
MLQNDLACFKRFPMAWIDQTKFMPSDINGINYLNRKIESGRVDIVGPMVFIFDTPVDPQINRIIWLVECNPARWRLLLPLVIVSKSFLSIGNYVSHHDAGPNPGQPLFIGADDLFDPAIRTRPNFCADRTSQSAEPIANDQLWMYRNTLGGRVANISIFEVYDYRDGEAINGQTRGFGFIQLNPGSVASNKSVLSNAGLGFSRFGLPMCFSYGVSCSAESLKQDIKASGGYANREQGDEHSRNANESLPRPILPLLGAMMMIGGLTLCWWSIAQRRAWPLMVGWALGCVGTTMIAIGLGNYVTPLL